MNKSNLKKRNYFLLNSKNLNKTNLSKQFLVFKLDLDAFLSNNISSNNNNTNKYKLYKVVWRNCAWLEICWR